MTRGLAIFFPPAARAPERAKDLPPPSAEALASFATMTRGLAILFPPAARAPERAKKLPASPRRSSHELRYDDAKPRDSLSTCRQSSRTHKNFPPPPAEALTSFATMTRGLAILFPPAARAPERAKNFPPLFSTCRQNPRTRKNFPPPPAEALTSFATMTRGLAILFPPAARTPERAKDLPPCPRRSSHELRYDDARPRDALSTCRQNPRTRKKLPASPPPKLSRASLHRPRAS